MSLRGAPALKPARRGNRLIGEIATALPPTARGPPPSILASPCSERALEGARVLPQAGLGMNIVLTGSIAFDYLMSFPGRFRDHILADRLDRLSLSFLVDTLIRRRGCGRGSDRG